MPVTPAHLLPRYPRTRINRRFTDTSGFFRRCLARGGAHGPGRRLGRATHTAALGRQAYVVTPILRADDCENDHGYDPYVVELQMDVDGPQPGSGS
jgi:hypothetical protein